MATRDTFVSIVDGDQLNDGYFNDIFKQAVLVKATITGSTTSETESTLGSVSFAASELAVTDLIMIDVVSEKDGDTFGEWAIQLDDGTNTPTSTLTSNNGAQPGVMTYKIWQNPLTTTQSIISCHDTRGTGGGGATFDTDTMIANWMSAAFTLNCRVKVTAGASDGLAAHYTFKIYTFRNT